ncbi:MAG TPA: hypothetical protein VGV37_22320 [Aliidongia sp.]|uniref:hypothetical protein n=1 Tax=Aliidongia sp. TaxID=1914230 RepID=UPI002DDD1104|nr:hypothetical protein [Aliidongia sp.]HEV2677280.1 hypothetical protein [Aliidongia sp.]
MNFSAVGNALRAALVISTLLAPMTGFAAECVLKKTAEIPIREWGRFLIFDAMVDHHPIKAAFGNGQRVAEITPDLAALLGVAPGSSSPPFSRGAVSLNTLQVDNQSIRDFDAEVLTDDPPPLPQGVQLRVGPEVFGNLDLEIDLSRHRLALFQSDHCPGQVVYWAKQWFEMPYHVLADGAPAVEVEVNGSTVTAGLMLAYPYTNITAAKAWAVGAEKTSKRNYILDRLALDGVTLRHLNVRSLEIQELEGNGNISRADARQYGLADLMIGRNNLEKLHIFISRKDHTVYFTLASPD